MHIDVGVPLVLFLAYEKCNRPELSIDNFQYHCIHQNSVSGWTFSSVFIFACYKWWDLVSLYKNRCWSRVMTELSFTNLALICSWRSCLFYYLKFHILCYWIRDSRLKCCPDIEVYKELKSQFVGKPKRQLSTKRLSSRGGSDTMPFWPPFLPIHVVPTALILARGSTARASISYNMSLSSSCYLQSTVYIHDHWHRYAHWFTPMPGPVFSNSNREESISSSRVVNMASLRQYKSLTVQEGCRFCKAEKYMAMSLLSLMSHSPERQVWRGCSQPQFQHPQRPSWLRSSRFFCIESVKAPRLFGIFSRKTKFGCIPMLSLS